MKRISVFAVIAIAMFVGACGHKVHSGQQAENLQQHQDQVSIQHDQPLPHFSYSQKRQNLIEIETAEANGVQTTSFFFNQGVRDPIQICPSIGAPIPTTTQLSNPSKVVDSWGRQYGDRNYGGGEFIIPQEDPTAVYDAGNSSGTNIICIGADGKPYADYWEGFVQTVFGPAKWNYTTHTAELVGPPSFTFTKHK